MTPWRSRASTRISAPFLGSSAANRETKISELAMEEVSTAAAEAAVEEGLGEGLEREVEQMRRGRRKVGL